MDAYLNAYRQAKVPVELVLRSGNAVQGRILSFDRYTLLVEAEVTDELSRVGRTQVVLIYKHAVDMIGSADDGPARKAKRDRWRKDQDDASGE